MENMWIVSDLMNFNYIFDIYDMVYIGVVKQLSHLYSIGYRCSLYICEQYIYHIWANIIYDTHM